MKNKIRDKEIACGLLVQLGEIKERQDRLLRWKNENVKDATPYMKVKIRNIYKEQMEVLDHKADKLAAKLMKILSKYRKIVKKEFLKFPNGILDRGYVDFVFKNSTD